MPIPPSQAAVPRSKRIPQIALAFFSTVWIATAIQPKNRQDWFLENLLVFVVVPLLIATFRKFRFSNFAYGCITAFLVLHAIGAHYTYSETPLGDWLRDLGGLRRNHYDRIVHFAFGLLLCAPLREVFLGLGRFREGWRSPIAIAAILAASAVYEILEAAVAGLVDPSLGDAYTGTQGDVWDPQKDMALALFGAVLAMGAAALARRIHNRKNQAAPIL